jgi:hypothetical protein
VSIEKKLNKIKKNQYWFYRCVHNNCGKWHYSKKRIKKKKCLKCNRTFKFSHSVKFSQECTRDEAIAIIKHLKEKEAKEEYGFFKLNLNTSGGMI